MCGNIACAVNTIENEQDLPLIWRADELGKLEGPKAGHPNRQMQRERDSKPLMGELGADVGESCVVEYDDECDDRDFCILEDESATAKGDYVSLVDNPERYTGYSGPSANQVWEAIYRENCFSRALSSQHSSSSPVFSPSGFGGLQGQAVQGFRDVVRQHERQQSMSPGSLSQPLEETLDLDDECLEKRVFYRIISGMHASISTHLCWDYLNKTSGNWEPNTQCFKERLQIHPERISNLYFNYALVMRAVAKVRQSLQTYTFCSGDPIQDTFTKSQVLTLAERIASGPNIYDESLMFQDPIVNGLKTEFKTRFRNVTRTMDCVGCDKCRLWGKLQAAGYGTALKILFEFDEQDQRQNPPLRRTELVALMNTLDKISHSLKAVREFQAMLDPDDQTVLPNPGQLRDEDVLKDEYDDKSDEDQEDEEEGIMDAIKQEFTVIWRTTRFVLRKWYETPRVLSRIIILELARIYEFWMGLEVHERSWHFRKPSKDEI